MAWLAGLGSLRHQPPGNITPAQVVQSGRGYNIIAPAKRPSTAYASSGDTGDTGGRSTHTAASRHRRHPDVHEAILAPVMCSSPQQYSCEYAVTGSRQAIAAQGQQPHWLLTCTRSSSMTIGTSHGCDGQHGQQRLSPPPPQLGYTSIPSGVLVDCTSTLVFPAVY
jgi:hypothetical protein